MKSFAKLAASVCRDWHDIVHARSGCRFWYTTVTFGGGPRALSVGTDAARFKHGLESSENSDIDVYFSIDWLITEFQDLEPFERLGIHVFLMLIPYARQIRAMEIRSRPLTQLLVAIRSLGPLPRLEFFKLRGILVGFVDVVDSLLSPHYPDVPPVLDFSSSGSNITLSLKYWDILGRVKAQQSATYLKVTQCWTHLLRYAKWEDLQQLLSENPCIKKLDLAVHQVSKYFIPTP